MSLVQENVIRYKYQDGSVVIGDGCEMDQYVHNNLAEVSDILTTRKCIQCQTPKSSQVPRDGFLPHDDVTFDFLPPST